MTIKLQLHLSDTDKAASAVVPDPLKKSRMISPSLIFARFIIVSINFRGFGLLNAFLKPTYES